MERAHPGSAAGHGHEPEDGVRRGGGGGGGGTRGTGASVKGLAGLALEGDLLIARKARREEARKGEEAAARWTACGCTSSGDRSESLRRDQEGTNELRAKARTQITAELRT